MNAGQRRILELEQNPERRKAFIDTKRKKYHAHHTIFHRGNSELQRGKSEYKGCKISIKI